ncbi:MAG: hypothetical protein JST89_17750 [Cyanobacteria bacterium SZAS-4]|nr:hypothetical protein [Cyanobacteria bacterium SZAS-4]
MTDRTIEHNLKQLESARERLAERIRLSQKTLDELDAKIVAIKSDLEKSQKSANTDQL